MDNIECFLFSRSYSANTQVNYRYILHTLQDEVLDLEHMSPGTFRNWLEKEKWGGCMRWTAYNAVKSYLRHRYGPMHPALTFRIKREDAGPQRVLSHQQAKQLLHSFDVDTTQGVRDRAIATMMLDTGLRSAEICRLDIRYIDLSRRMLSVIVKGGRWEDAVFSARTAEYLQHWLTHRSEVAKTGVKTFFVSTHGLTTGKNLTPSGFRCIVRAWGKQAGIGALSPHDFRRSFATLCILNRAPTRIVQVGGRWKNIDMVERYTPTIRPEDLDPYFPVMFL